MSVPTEPESPVAPRASGRLVVWLTIALVPSLTLTAMVTSAFKAEQRELAGEWSSRGEAALQRGRPSDAIEAYRNALTYSHENRAFRLRLAQALAADGRTAEARAYLLTLRDAQPGNGPVNLELGRLAVNDRDVTEALRYYHSAIEGAWSEDAESHRRSARLELAQFLVLEAATTPAQAELIALAGDLPANLAFQRGVAALMGATGLEGRAIAIYDRVLSESPDDAEALSAAGRLAFRIGSYRAAVSYLSELPAAARGEETTDVLQTARLVLALDPYQRSLRLAERARRVRRGFVAATNRLRGCLGSEPIDPTSQQLQSETLSLEPKVARSLTRDPDLIDTVMDLIFRIEHATAARCGEPEGVDRALLLIARQRQETGS